MARGSHSVLRALARWEAKGLVDAGLTRSLKEEVEEEARSVGHRWSQYLLAATGGVVLIVAGGTFLAWAWPEMGYAGQTLILAAVGFLVLALGFLLPNKGKWKPVAYLLQVAGSVLLVMALIYSENAWTDGSTGGWAAGVLALILPGVLLRLALREHEILAGLQAALSFLFLFVFLDRALGVSEETALWILDSLMVLGLAFLSWALRRSDAPGWALSVFWALLFSAVALIMFSAEILWDLEAGVMYPLDLWLLTIAGLTIWGLREGAPSQFARSWYEHLLALCVLTGIPFGFVTMLETLDTGPTPAALVVGALGVGGFGYALPRGSRSVLIASSLALIIAAWYWGAEMSGAPGAVLALLAVSMGLFWGAMRMGRLKNDRRGEGEAALDA